MVSLLLGTLIESLNIPLEEKYNKTLLIKFELCSNIGDVKFIHALTLLAVVFEQFNVSVQNFQTLHKRREYKAISCKKGQKLLQLISKCRFVINSVHGEYQLYEQLEEKRRESLKKGSISYRVLSRAKTAGGNGKDDVFSRLTRTKMDTQVEYPEELVKEHEELISQTEGNEKTPGGMKKFIDKCLQKILPRRLDAEGTAKVKTERAKVLEIDKKDKSKNMMIRSIKILKQSAYHKDPQIRGYVGCLIKELEKDYKRSKGTGHV